jgi:hypothetical protein
VLQRAARGQAGSLRARAFAQSVQRLGAVELEDRDPSLAGDEHLRRARWRWGTDAPARVSTMGSAAGAAFVVKGAARGTTTLTRHGTAADIVMLRKAGVWTAEEIARMTRGAARSALRVREEDIARVPCGTIRMVLERHFGRPVEREIGRAASLSTQTVYSMCVLCHQKHSAVNRAEVRADARIGPSRLVVSKPSG